MTTSTRRRPFSTRSGGASAGGRRPLWPWVAVLGIALLVPAVLRAQGKVRVRVTGGPVSFPAPTVTDYNNGFLSASGTLTYTVSGTGGGNGISHTSTVSVQATTGTLGGTKSITDLQWRRADLSTWNPMTTTGAQIEQRVLVRRGSNDPWSNQIFLRMLLSYANDGPGTHSAKLVFTLTITTP